MIVGVHIKKIILRIFFAGEIIIMILSYLGGAHGLPTLIQLQREKTALVAEITLLRTHVMSLEQEIAAWKERPFYYEKMAREQLHMARPDDIIFYMPEKN
jgi:cell division protein FtsB